jgi:hypothetical protein
MQYLSVFAQIVFLGITETAAFGCWIRVKNPLATLHASTFAGEVLHGCEPLPSTWYLSVRWALHELSAPLELLGTQAFLSFKSYSGHTTVTRHCFLTYYNFLKSPFHLFFFREEVSR